MIAKADELDTLVDRRVEMLRGYWLNYVLEVYTCQRLLSELEREKATSSGDILARRLPEETTWSFMIMRLQSSLEMERPMTSLGLEGMF